MHAPVRPHPALAGQVPVDAAAASARRAVIRWVVPHRISLFIGMWLMRVMVPSPPAPYGVQLGDGSNAGNLFIDGWLRWDVHWYWHIAAHGYTALAQFRSGQRDVVFFPLFPLLARIVHVVVPDLYAAGMLVSNAAFLVGAYLLYRLSALRQGEEVARRALILLAAYPFSFIFSAMYTEGLFFLAAMLAFFWGEQDRWAWAALAAAAAGLTRVPGVLVAGGVALLYLEKIRFRPKAIRWDALWLSIGFTGPLPYMAYLWIRFGDPLLFIRAEQAQGWMAGHGYHELVGIAARTLSISGLEHGRIDVVESFSLLVSALALIACIHCLKRGRIAYGIWGLLSIAVSLINPAPVGRYLMVVFPLYLVGAERLRGPVLTFVVSAGALLGAALMLLWSHWTFVC